MSRPTSSRSSPAAATPSTSDISFPDPPTATVSAVVFSPTPNSCSTTVLASSWDHHVHQYLVTDTVPSKIRTFEHSAPVLDVCFVDDGLAASASVDRRVRLLDLQTGRVMVLGKHEDAVTKVRYCPVTKLLITGSSDRSLGFWSVESGHQGLLKKLDLADKVLAMDVSPPFPNTDTAVYSASVPGKAVARDSTPRLVVGTVGRHVFVYDLVPLRSAIDRERSGATVADRDWQPDQRRESSLKFMARDLRCMPAGDGYAMSSIEGRIAVEFFDPREEKQKMKYAFKCHREQEGDEDVVYPVHGVVFHPRHGTFASLGGDSIVSVWDAAAKKRIRQYPKFSAPVTAGSFDPSGTLLCIATGNDKPEEKGAVATELIFKCNVDEECKPKLKSSSKSKK